MKLGLSEMSTMQATFEDDVAVYSAAGFAGIGIFERKLPADDEANVARLEAAGLETATCLPALFAILPMPMRPTPEIDFTGPSDVDERIDRICASIRRFARYKPQSLIFLTGSPKDFDPREARRIVIDGIRRIDAVATEVGVKLALEPMHRTIDRSMIHSVGEAAELLDEAGVTSTGICVDSYHVGDSPTLFEDIRRYSDKVTGVQMSDRSADPAVRGHLLPGTGVTPTAKMVATLVELGWSGFVDTELMSPEKYWQMPLEPLVHDCYAAATAIARDAQA